MKMEKNLKKRSVEKFVDKIVRCAFEEIAQVLENNPNGISLLKVNNRNSKTSFEHCQHVSHLVLLFL